MFVAAYYLLVSSYSILHDFYFLPEAEVYKRGMWVGVSVGFFVRPCVDFASHESRKQTR